MNNKLFIMLEAYRLFKLVYGYEGGLVGLSDDHIHVTTDFFKSITEDAEVTVTDCNGKPQLNAKVCGVDFITLVTKPKMKYEYRNGEVIEVAA